MANLFSLQLLLNRLQFGLEILALFLQQVCFLFPLLLLPVSSSLQTFYRAILLREGVFQARHRAVRAALVGFEVGDLFAQVVQLGGFVGELFFQTVDLI